MIFSALLENGTHLVQPLDRTAFSVLKNAMKKCINAWSLANPGKTLSRYTLIEVVYPAFRAAFGNGDVIRESFRATDIWPWGRGNVDLNRLKPSEVFAPDPDEDDVVSHSVSHPPIDDHNSHHLTATVPAPLEVEAALGELDLAADSGAALPYHQLDLQLGQESQESVGQGGRAEQHGVLQESSGEAAQGDQDHRGDQGDAGGPAHHIEEAVGEDPRAGERHNQVQGGHREVRAKEGPQGGEDQGSPLTTGYNLSCTPSSSITPRTSASKSSDDHPGLVSSNNNMSLDERRRKYVYFLLLSSNINFCIAEVFFKFSFLGRK